jgi:hypothetical protein
MQTTRMSSWLLATGFLHQVAGLLAGLGVIDMPGAEARRPLSEIVGAGVVNAVEPDLARSTFVWFVMFGFVLLMLGDLARRWERSSVPLPRALGVQLLALSSLGIALFPVSGFWLCLPLACRIIYPKRAASSLAAQH